MMDYYEIGNLDDEVKFTLMILMIGYCNDMVGENNLDVYLWENVKKILIEEKELHFPTIEYWSSLDTDLEDAWYIAPLIRELFTHYDMSNANPDLHTTFYNWILENKAFWHLRGIEIEKTTDLRTSRPYPQPPFVAVSHQSTYGLGEIHLYQVNNGYIIEFYAGSLAVEQDLVYIYEFSENPKFDLWQERYVEFLSKGKVLTDC